MNIIKLSTIALMLSSGSVMAGTMGPVGPVEIYNGFYVGGTVGVSNLTNKSKVDTVRGLETHNLGGTNVTGGGLLGYDYSINDRFKLGVEAYIYGNGNQNANATHDYNDTQYTSYEKYNWGIRVLPGIEFNRGVVGHVILGYTGGKFHQADNGAYGSIDTSFYQSGFQSGLGFTSMFNQNFFVRVDGLYTTFGSHTDYGINLSNVLNTYKANLNTLEADLTIGYKFS